MNELTKRVLDLAYSRKGWNQVELAEALGVGKNNVTNWKARGIPYSMLPKAAEKIGCTVDELLTGKTQAAQKARTVTEWGITVTEEGFLFAAEFDKLQEPFKKQIHDLVHGMVGTVKREEVKAPARTSVQPPTQKSSQKPGKAADERQGKRTN